jgi:hypothetical protein
MWLAIIYVCFAGVQVQCEFATKIVQTKSDCLTILSEIEPVMQQDDNVLMFDKRCIELSII